MKWWLAATVLLLAGVGALLLLGDRDGGATQAATDTARLQWKEKPSLILVPELPRDRILTGQLRNASLRAVDLDTERVQILDADGPQPARHGAVRPELLARALPVVDEREGLEVRAPPDRQDRHDQAGPGGAADAVVARARGRLGAGRGALRRRHARHCLAEAGAATASLQACLENSFDARADLEVGGETFEIYRLDALQSKFDVARLPFSLKVLLENLLRNEDGVSVSKEDIEALASWDANADPSEEIAFTPARVVMQDFTGVPAVVDLAAMRDAMADNGGEPSKINPLVPAELVIDHSVQVDAFGTRDAFKINADLEFERNQERYAFLRWGQDGFDNFAVVPPDTGIVHQVNLEYLARVVFTSDETAHEGPEQAYPDTLVGTDSHTTMINGLGVLGWGVGGIEAEAAMLGQPMSMLIPQVLGFKLSGELPEGATATDLVLTVTQMLRERGVVGMFVEFFGPGVAALPLADRATIGNMSPEFGSTCAIFPIDAETLRYLEFSGRPQERVALVEAYAKEQGLWHDEDSEEPTYSDTLELDLSQVVPSLAGPKRPQDRVSLTESKAAFRLALEDLLPDDVEDPKEGEPDPDEESADSFPSSDPPSSGDPANHDGARDRSPQPSDGGTGGLQVAERTEVTVPVTLEDGTETELDHGHVVIAAITSCTNTSNPSVMLGSGLLARNAVQKGLKSKPWVKTSLAPGSKVVTEYLDRAGLTDDLEALGFHLVGYGCTTCIGNSGPLPEEISDVVQAEDLAVVSVLSGNRNFEGRINPDVKMNYLASPPLCVAYAIAGTMDIDLLDEPLGQDQDGNDVFLKDIWPSEQEIAETVEERRAERHVPQVLRRGLRRRRALELARRADRRPLRVGRGLDLRAPAAVLRGLPGGAARTSRTSRARACSPSSATRSPPTTSRPRATSRRARRPASTSRSTASSARTSTPTARAAATTR